MSFHVDSLKNEPRADKLDEVRRAGLRADIAALRALAKSPGGLNSDQARRVAWPLLLGSKHEDERSDAAASDTDGWKHLPKHRDEDQVALDVDRSFVYYPREDSDEDVHARRQLLSNIIVSVLRQHPLLCYFQGYHDIAQVFLLVLGSESAAVSALERLSLLRIRDFMLPSMNGALSHLSLLPAVLSAADSVLYRHLAQTAPFYFALPATLTLYAHDIQEYGDIARLFDYLLASEAIISIYLFAVIICSRKKQLLELEPGEHDMLHATLSKLPKPLDLDHLICETEALYARCPPERLKGFAWLGMSRYSVLKTAREPSQVIKQSLAQGESFFRLQAEEMRRQEARRESFARLRRLGVHYRRPAVFIGSSILIAFLSFYVLPESTQSAQLRLSSAMKEWGRMLFTAKPP